MSNYDKFREAIVGEMSNLGKVDEATHPVSYGYLLGLKMALSWAAVLLKDKEEEKIGRHEKAEWIDISVASEWNYQCSACGMREDTMASFCRGCGAEMENA